MNLEKKRAVIFDLDGTLTNCEHRLPLIKNGNRKWDEFFAGIPDDKPIREILCIQNMFAQQRECMPSDLRVHIVLVTARPYRTMDDTVAWLKKNQVDYDAMYMRAEGDYRPDTEVKRDILSIMQRDGFEPFLAFEDRARVVQMYRDHGIRTLQVGPDFDNRKAEIERESFRSPTLSLMVGPSGAGKSTFIRENYVDGIVLSTDKLREDMTGDFKDMSRDSEMFDNMHSVVETMLKMGQDVCVDATNIRDKDRKTFLGYAPSNCIIKYYVIDRPLADKIRDGGWRNEIIHKRANRPLMTHHETVFRSNLHNILKGDGDPRVTVIDLRDDETKAFVR